MTLSRPYQGRSQEVKWDKDLINQKRGSEEPRQSKRILEPEEDSDDLEQSSPSSKSHPLSVLFQELSSSDESDSSFDGNPN